MKSIENALKELFALQRFAGEPRLQRLIDETEGRYGRELSDDMLDLVNAAGEPDIALLKKKDGRGDDE